jgi:protease-4
VLLDLRYTSGAGQPTLDEFARAIDDFRRSGKKVVAFGEAYERDTYFLAAHADEIHLDPMGLVAFEGYDRYRRYYEAALDKLGVDVNVYRVGVYKSAVEPFIRNDMSAEDREESQVFVNALCDSYVKSVAAARKLTPEAFSSYVATLSARVQAAKGDASKVALDAKLVAALTSYPDVEQRMIKLVGTNDDGDSFADVDLKDYLRVAHAEKKLKKQDGRKSRSSSPRVRSSTARAKPAPSAVSRCRKRSARRDSTTTSKRWCCVSTVRAAACSHPKKFIGNCWPTKPPSVRSWSRWAISPLRAGITSSAPADEIWASPATITGSIGIFGLFPTFNRAIDKIGVSTDGVGTTPLSGVRLDRPVNPAMATLLQSVIEHGYDEFLARVSKGRNKTRDEVHAIAQGRVWAGRDALRIGLVDHFRFAATGCRGGGQARQARRRSIFRSLSRAGIVLGARDRAIVQDPDRGHRAALRR